MNDKIQKAFDDITATESLKTRTTRQVIAKRQNRKHISFFRPVYALAATALLLIAFAGYGMYFTPRSVISVDINPSVEMEVNMFDRVISVKGYNEDGRRPADSVDVIHQNYYTALDSLINSENLSELSNLLKRSLSPFEYRVMTLYVDGASMNEICAAVGKNYKSVDNAIARSKGKLQKILRG